jgi:sugar lactone lactonase YvrE
MKDLLKDCLALANKNMNRYKKNNPMKKIINNLNMKKILSFGFAFLIFLFLFTKGTAQLPKLGNAFYFSSGIVADSKGNAFVVGKNNKIIKITPAGKAGLFAGDHYNPKDGKRAAVWFSNTTGIAIDSADNMYVADGKWIRKITPDGTVSTIAGKENSDGKNGDRETASFLHLDKIAIDNKGNIYVTDYALGKNGIPNNGNTGLYVIRKISSQGVVTTLKNETNGELRLWWPRGLACDKDGNLYVCASISHCIKKITPGGLITSVAGQCDKKEFNSVYKEGNIATAVLTNPSGIAIAKNGDIYISDTRLHRIIKISNDKVTTVAGNGKIDFTGNPAGYAEAGYADGNPKKALFNAPSGIAFDRNGNLYIVDGSSNNSSYIRKISPDGTVSTFCKHFFNPQTQQYEERD